MARSIHTVSLGKPIAAGPTRIVRRPSSRYCKISHDMRWGRTPRTELSRALAQHPETRGNEPPSIRQNGWERYAYSRSPGEMECAHLESQSWCWHRTRRGGRSNSHPLCGGRRGAMRSMPAGIFLEWKMRRNNAVMSVHLIHRKCRIGRTSTSRIRTADHRPSRWLLLWRRCGCRISE